MTGQASGFPCPECGHMESIVTDYWQDEDTGILLGVTLLCKSCETVWNEGV